MGWAILCVVCFVVCVIVCSYQIECRRIADVNRESMRKERDDHQYAWRKASDERDALAQKLADGIRVLSERTE